MTPEKRDDEFIRIWAGTLDCYCSDLDGVLCAPCQFRAHLEAVRQEERRIWTRPESAGGIDGFTAEVVQALNGIVKWSDPVWYDHPAYLDVDAGRKALGLQPIIPNADLRARAIREGGDGE